MKLSVYAQKIGVRYETAWRWFKAGSIRGHQLPTATIIITEDEPTTNALPRIAIYARVSREDLLTDLVAIVYSFAARLYGQRRAKRKTELIVKELTQGADDATG